MPSAVGLRAEQRKNGGLSAERKLLNDFDAFKVYLTASSTARTFKRLLLNYINYSDLLSVMVIENCTRGI